MSRLRIVGNGGHAREVATLATSAALHLGEDPQLLGPDDEAAALALPGPVAVGVGSPRVRRQIWDRWSGEPHLSWPTLVHATSVLGARTTIGAGVGVQAGVTMTCDIRIAEFSYLSPLVTVGHDVRIGRWCLVNPSANLSGGVTVGDGVLVGVGAVILENIAIGVGATVGAGAVVTRDVPPGVTVVGVPARAVGADR
jgi:sugar O-acyltransferase (sialic acid O-acetyltransferase NeuD family)